MTDARRLLRLLEPLMPEEVRHWRRTLEIADAPTRALLEMHITTTARRVLGEHERKVLLSLPPEGRIRGPITLGTVCYESEKWEAGITEQELLQHLAVFGRSGAGKTNVVFSILEQLDERSVPFLFLDWKRTCRHLLPHLRRPVRLYTPGRSLAPFPFNPFIPPAGVEPTVYLHLVVDVLGDALTLGDGARSLLHRTLKTFYDRGDLAPAPPQLLAALDAIQLTGREAGWKVSARRAVESIDLAGLVGGTPAAQHELARLLLTKNAVLELDSLSQGVRRFLIPILCLWVYQTKLAAPQRERFSLAIVLEESHHVLYRQERRAKETLMNSLLRQFRELGVGVIVVDQHPALISSAGRGNIFTSICMSLRDPADLAAAAALSGVDPAEKDLFGRLPTGHGIVKLQDRWRRPFLVRFPLVDVRKGSVTDADLIRRLADVETGSPPSPPEPVSSEQVRQGPIDVRPQGTALAADEIEFLRDVIEHPNDGVKARYKRLGWSVHRGNRMKVRLHRLGWLESHHVPVGRTRKVVLGLTTSGTRAIGLDAGSMPDVASLPHRYWQRWYAQALVARGFEVAIEAARHGGRVDVLATRNGRRIGVEIETGRSDAIGNVLNGLREGLDEVWVVAVGGEAMTKVQTDLGRAGLLIDGRVRCFVAPGLPEPPEAPDAPEFTKGQNGDLA